MDPLIGKELDGRYRLVAELGEGAMGRVYRADRLDGTGAVAVKVLNEDCSEQPDLRERFEREARALFGLQHPHILDVQDYGVIDGQQPYLVMELLEGQSLDDMVDEEKLPPALGLSLAMQILEGLAYAHRAGVLHRDLKTENVFVCRLPDGRPHAKLLDFGLVKFVDDERWGEGRKLTVAGSVMGSPAYMSPEQGTGGAMDARSDVYSAGVVLFELVTGRWPFIEESRMEMLKAHLLHPIPTLASAKPGLSARPELDAVLQRAMAKDASDRFVDAQEMLYALRSVPQPAVSYSRPASPPPGALPPPPVASLPPSGQAAGVHVSGGLRAEAAPSPHAQLAPVAAAPMQPGIHPAGMQPPPMQPAMPESSPPRSKVAIFVVLGLVACCLVVTLIGLIGALVAR